MTDTRQRMNKINTRLEQIIAEEEAFAEDMRADCRVDPRYCADISRQSQLIYQMKALLNRALDGAPITEADWLRLY